LPRLLNIRSAIRREKFRRDAETGKTAAARKSTGIRPPSGYGPATPLHLRKTNLARLLARRPDGILID
jgi:hypothetical protein